MREEAGAFDDGGPCEESTSSPLNQGEEGAVRRSSRTGLLVVHIGRTSTLEDIRSLEDDE